MYSKEIEEWKSEFAAEEERTEAHRQEALIQEQQRLEDEDAAIRVHRRWSIRRSSSTKRYVTLEFFKRFSFLNGCCQYRSRRDSLTSGDEVLQVVHDREDGETTVIRRSVLSASRQASIDTQNALQDC